MQVPEHLPPQPLGGPENDILARVQSQFVAQAARTLPDPACAVDDVMSVDIDAAWVGRVRLTFKKQRYCRPRAKAAYFAWHCVRAVPAPLA
ncbi:hypothetical protein [Roseateles sp. BYS87W]|uniref:Transposase n=1 Tax=Pelomonas baiyunensis TaxID=3299026 RepID=A0ABW7GTN0_9BURK